MGSLQMQVKTQCEELQAKATQIASLEVDVLTRKMQVCSLQSANKAQTAMVAKLEHKIEDLDGKIVNLQADVEVKSRDVVDLTSEATKRSKKLESKTAQIVSLTAEVKWKTDQIAHLESAVELMTDRTPDPEAEDKSGKLEYSIDEIASLRKEALTMDSEIATLLRIDAHKRELKLQDQDKRIGDLEKDIKPKDELISIMKVSKTAGVDEQDQGRKKEASENDWGVSSNVSLD